MNIILLFFLFLSILVTNVLSIYTHAAFVNDIRRSKQWRTLSIYDPSEEYSLQMNNTALFGLPPCSHLQCERIAVVGAGLFLLLKFLLLFFSNRRGWINHCLRINSCWL
jgi:hypothetical protein